MSGIQACGVYLPRLRLERTTVAAATGWMNPPAGKPAHGARAISSWDEDSLTMGVAAARNCLRRAESSAIARVELASTTLPFADRSNAGLLAAALALDGAVSVADVTGSLRCATSALIRALQHDMSTLLVAAEKRQAKPGSAQEMELGHGAAAMLVGGTDAAVSMLGTASLARDFVDHHRDADADFDYAFEERWVRDEAYFKLVPATIAKALDSAQVAATAITHFICPGSPAIAKRIAQTCGFPAEAVTPDLTIRVGNLGSAHALFALALALDSAPPDSTLVLVGFGQGVDVLVLRVNRRTQTEPIVAKTIDGGVPERSYVRYLSNNDLLDMDFGMRAERDHRSAQTTAYRKRDALTAFIGGRCERCNTVQFPRSRVCVNPQCRQTDTQVPHRLADRGGRVKTFTEDWQAYSPRPPYIYGNVTFAEGGNLFMEFCDLEPGELQVDSPVSFQFRIKDIDRVRHFKRYFWKAAPAR